MKEIWSRDELVDELKRLLNGEVARKAQDFVSQNAWLSSVVLVLVFLWWAFRPHRPHFFGKGYFETQPRRFMVTCAASPLGRSFVRNLVSRGHQVLALDKDFRALKLASGEWREVDNRVELKPLDPSTQTDWESARRFIVKVFGGVDVLINLAGMETFEPSEVDSVLDCNLRGIVLGANCIGRLMQQQVEHKGIIGGHIVNVLPLESLGMDFPSPKQSSPSFNPVLVAASTGARGFSSSFSQAFVDAGVYSSSLIVARPEKPESYFVREASGEELDYVFEQLYADVLVARKSEAVAFSHWRERVRVWTHMALGGSNWMYWWRRMRR